MEEFSVAGDGAQTARGRRRGGWWWLLPSGVFVLGALLLIGGIGVFASGYRIYRIPSSVMSPTVANGDRVIASKTVGGANVNRGDIVIFDRSVWRDDIYQGLSVFRIVGIGGDTVSCCDEQNRLQVNGHSVVEDYVGPGTHPDSSSTQRPFSATVPQGRVLVLGDDRGDSFDSRFHRSEIGDGSLPRSAIRGRVVAIYHNSRFTTAQPTAAFRDAGLTGPSAPDDMWLWALASMGIGLVLTILSIFGAGVFGLLWALRVGRRGSSAGPPKSTVAAPEVP